MNSVADVEFDNVQHSQVKSRGRGLNNGLKVICQVWEKTGHIALHCYHRFDITYVGNCGSLGGYIGGNIQA